MSLFPTGYEQPKSNSHYFKPLDGNNLVRILSKPIMGWLDWKDTEDGKKSPVRTPYGDPKPQPLKSDKPVKHFWAFIIWDYTDKTIKIWEITQSTIQDAIYTLDCDSDWGEPTEYDLSINRSGKDLDTKYNTLPKPKQPLNADIVHEVKEGLPDMNELFTNGDPFAKKSVDEPVKEEINVKDIPF